jgi:hypothetical protein
LQRPLFAAPFEVGLLTERAAPLVQLDRADRRRFGLDDRPHLPGNGEILVAKCEQAEPTGKVKVGVTVRFRPMRCGHHAIPQKLVWSLLERPWLIPG